jgi:MraZ protein
VEATFFNTVVNKVDQKGRVSIPAPFRAQLLAENPMGNSIIFMPSFRLPTLEGSGLKRIERLRRELDRHEEFSEKYESLQAFFAEACQLALDPEGRVILPASLLEHANIRDNIAFVGAGSVFQIWEPSAYNEHKMLMRERRKREGTTLPPVARDAGGAVEESLLSGAMDA